MIAKVRGHLLLQRYEQFVKTLYADPKDEVIAGSYLTKVNLPVVRANDEVRAKKKKKNTKDEVKSKDIRNMLKKTTFVCALWSILSDKWKKLRKKNDFFTTYPFLNTWNM